MPYKADTIQGGYDQYQRHALKHIEAISVFWGIDLATQKEWNYLGQNHYSKHNERDSVKFGDMVVERVLEERGRSIPSDMKPKKAIIDSIDNDAGTPLGFERSYKEIEFTKKVDESSSLFGWSLEISHTHKVEASGEIAGIGGSGSSETSIKAETHGEIYEHSLTETQDTGENTLVIKGTVPPESEYFIEQQFDRGTIEVPIHQLIVIDLKFQVDDWKRLRKSKDQSLSKSHRNKSQRGSKTHSLLVVESSQDFLELATGIHSDYPNQRTNHVVENTPISESIRWLLDPKNRAIEVDIRQKYENGTSSHTRVLDDSDNPVEQGVEYYNE